MSICKVNAKINLSLNIIAKDDGFHSLDTVIASVGSSELMDAISVLRRGAKGRLAMESGVLDARKKGISRSENGGLVAGDDLFYGDNIRLKMRPKLEIENEQNTAYRAAKLFCERFSIGGVDILIEKGIPIGGGLGGSSADAAGVLLLLAREFLCEKGHEAAPCDEQYLSLDSLGISTENASKVALIALECGCDVPFMLYGGFARATGRGERLERFTINASFFGVVAKGEGSVNTGECYALFDKMYEGGALTVCDNDALCAALKKGDPFLVAKNMANALDAPARALNGGIGKTCEQLIRAGALKAVVSGSGACVFGLFEDKARADRAARELKGRLPLAESVELLH